MKRVVIAGFFGRPGLAFPTAEIAAAAETAATAISHGDETAEQNESLKNKNEKGAVFLTAS